MDYRDDYDRGRRYRGESYYGGYYSGPDREREWRDSERRGEYGRRRGDDRGFFERAGDEVRSWFGDEEAQRRRMRDEREEARGWGGPSRSWGGREEDADRGWARQWGYVEGRGRGSSGQQDWQYRDIGGYREPEWSSGYQRYMGPSWTRESGYGGEGYGGERGRDDRSWGERSGWGDASAWGTERGGRSAPWMGPHAGRGPRGYTRSDERIREDVCDRLCEHGFVDASDIEVRVAGGEVTLVGFVRERNEKRIAEDAAEQVSGVREVNNQLRVRQGEQGGEQSGGDQQGGRPFRAAWHPASEVTVRCRTAAPRGQSSGAPPCVLRD
jgi:osmotically-inducible protein OsmY